MCVHVLWLYTAQTESSACSKKRKVHISSDDYNELFVGSGSETFLVDRLQCVMTCLKRGQEVRLAAYDNSTRLCCCVGRDVESVQENEQTVEVYLVDFCRGEVTCVDKDVESVQENEQTVEVYLVSFCRGELC